MGTNTRFETTCIYNPHKWIECIKNGENGLITENLLSKREISEEIIIMGLRTLYGINTTDIKQRFNLDITDFINTQALQDFIQNDLLAINNNCIVATHKGIPVIDGILNKIIK